MPKLGKQNFTETYLEDSVDRRRDDRSLVKFSSTFQLQSLMEEALWRENNRIELAAPLEFSIRTFHAFGYSLFCIVSIGALVVSADFQRSITA